MTEPADPSLLDHGVTQRLRDELALDAAGIGTFDLDLVTGELDWDDRLIAMFGYADGGFDRSMQGFQDRVHPDDLTRVGEALQAAIDRCGDFHEVYRIRVPGQATQWITARGRTLCDPDGTAVRFLGAASDTTAVHRAAQSVTRVLEAMPAAFFSLDRDWEFTYVNAQAQRLLQPVNGDLVGRVIWTEFPAAVGSPFETHYRHAMDSGQNVTFEAYYPLPLDAWYEVRAWPNSDGMAVYFLDITARRRQQDRMQLLAEVADQLADTMDAEDAVARLARLVVPALADWCIVTLLGDDHPGGGRRTARDVGWWHRDEQSRPLVEEYARIRLAALREDSLLLRALASGERTVQERDATGLIGSFLDSERARALIGELAPASFVVQPLRGRGRTVGLLTLCNGPGRGAPTPEELDTLSEVAGRAGLALDNARLYRQQQQVAEGLQRSLLSAPPEPDHAEVVVRYLPAAESAAVGGDWYDAFLQADGATVLVIGDVAGHDLAAAATMGQLRGILRGIATSAEIGPAEMLSRLDASMALLDMKTLATAAVARIEQDADERRRGVTRLRWSNAGHPPPLVLHPDGTVAELTTGRPELMLGVDHHTARTESVLAVPRGSTVLLYTDGLVERRDSDLDAGLDRLRQTLADLAELPLDALCDQLLERLVDGRPDDDVALVAVRLHRQDLPRPPEAGPQQLPGPIADEEPHT